MSSGRCHCADDGGDACYRAALARVEGDEEATERVVWLNRSRRASGVPFHIIDPVVLAQVATILWPTVDRLSQH